MKGKEKMKKSELKETITRLELENDILIVEIDELREENYNLKKNLKMAEIISEN